MQRSVVLVFLLALAASATGREVAITIDDLPRGGDAPTVPSLEAVRAMTEKLLRPFSEQRIPVTGFVNEGRAVVFGADGLREVLELWLDAGAELGNHSHSHLSINNVPLAEFTADITRGEPIVRAALEARGRTLRYFRHPFLFTGPTPQIKAGLQSFLDEQGYVVAPVTFDNADYLFAAAYTRPEYRERARQEYVPYMEAVVASFEAAFDGDRTRDEIQDAVVQGAPLRVDEEEMSLAPRVVVREQHRGDAAGDAAHRAGPVDLEASGVHHPEKAFRIDDLADEGGAAEILDA